MRQKFLLLAMAMLGCFNVAQAEEGILTISDGTVQQGWYGCVTVNAKNFTAKTFNGFQMEVTLPTGLHFDKMVVDETATGYTDPEVSFNDKKGEENYGICMVFSLKDAVFKEGDFELCKIYFHADEDMPLGTYKLDIHGISMSGVDSQDHPVTDIASFNVEVIERTARVLDENAEEAPEDTYTTTKAVAWDDDGRAIEYQDTPLLEDILVKRTVKANTWSTFCMPFNLSAAQMGNQIFSRNIKVATLSPDIEFNQETNEVKLSFTTARNPAITANTLYLIYSDKEVTEFEVKDVHATFGTPETSLTYLDEDWNENTIKYVGVYNKQTIPEKGLFLSNNKFYYSNGKSTIKGFRGYFILDSAMQDLILGGASSEAPINSIIVEIDDVPTAIEGLTTDYKSNDDVYTISGVYMGKASDMKKFQRGMYIVNGKKVVIK